MGFTRETRRSGSLIRSSAAGKSSGTGLPGRNRELEVRFQPELHDARVEGIGELAEVAGTQIITYVMELGVIPRVESLDAEFQPAATRFAEDKALEQRQVPVIATGTTHCVVAEVAKGAECR